MVIFMAGRKPKPDALKEAQGNPGRRPLAKDQIDIAAQVDRDLPALGGTPPHLSAGGKKIWQQLAPQLEKINFIKTTDRNMFERYCDSLAEYWKVTRSLRRNKHTYWTNSNHGKLKRLNPEFMVQDRLDRRLQSLEDKMGLSPQARQNLLLKLSSATAPPPGGMFNDGKEGGETASEQPVAGRPGSAVGLLAPKSQLH
tara:strand:+ start:6351 stop:6944 length:594 start_codon:yes stop_codon:yes gene_type:complete